MLTVAVIGVVETRQDGVPVTLPRGKSTELLVRLAFDSGVCVRADALLEDLWGGAAARNTLQSKVSQLRRALGAAVVEGSAGGYTLGLDRSCIDAFQVFDLAAEASGARQAGDPATALLRANEGLALFTGEVLPDVGDWALPHRARLEEVRMGLVEDSVAARVDLGAGGEVVAELEALVARYPLREGLWSSLITALYRAGRQTDALAAYARVRRLLVNELGVEPGAALHAVEQQVLQQDPALAPAAGRDPVGVPGNLPATPARLVGRDREVAEVIARLPTQRLVSVVGPAGVGKTRIAIEVAQKLEPPGGVWLVRLDALGQQERIGGFVAETLHVPGGEPALRERLAGAETVVVLDNCEHVVDAAATLVASLLAAAPLLRVLATSQLPLGIDEESVVTLEPLSAGDSAELFAELAQHLRPGLVLDDEAAAQIGEICRSLDGLPLAIELAASRVRSLSVADIVRHLDDRFAFLSDPTSRRPERRRALSAAIGWSHDLLFPDDQHVLWAVSCFAGSASLDATIRVAGVLDVPAAAVTDSISRLVDRSLVTLDTAPDGSVRYRLLDSVRAFAADRLRASGQASAASAAHAGWYAERARWAAENIRGPEQPRCVATGLAERANIDLALAWCAASEPDLGARIAVGFGWTWVVLGDGVAGAARLRAAVSDAGTDHERLTGLAMAGWLEASAGDLGRAQDDLDQAMEIATALNDAVATADVRRHVAFLQIQQDRPADVVDSARAGLAVYRARGMSWEAAASQVLGAFGSLMLGDITTAKREGVEVTEYLASSGDSWGMVHVEGMNAGIAQAEHRFDDAVLALTRAVEESRRLGFFGQAALHLTSLARAQQRAGMLADSENSLREAMSAAATVGDGRLATTCRLQLSRLRRAEGDATTAVALLEENLRWFASAGGGEGELLSVCLLHATNGDVAGLRADLGGAAGQDNDEVRVLALDALAHWATKAGDHVGAAKLLTESDTLAPSIAHLVDDADRTDAHEAREHLAARAH